MIRRQQMKIKLFWGEFNLKLKQANLRVTDPLRYGNIFKYFLDLEISLVERKAGNLRDVI